MKNIVHGFFMIGVLLFSSSCKKEDCLNCEIISGQWEVEESFRIFIDDDLDLEYGNTYQIEFSSDGTGVFREHEMFWTFLVDYSQIYVSENIKGDSLVATSLFDIITSEENQQVWEEIDTYDKGTHIRRVERTWNLTK